MNIHSIATDLARSITTRTSSDITQAGLATLKNTLQSNKVPNVLSGAIIEKTASFAHSAINELNDNIEDKMNLNQNMRQNEVTKMKNGLLHSNDKYNQVNNYTQRVPIITINGETSGYTNRVAGSPFRYVKR